MGQLHIQSKNGHDVVEWDVEQQETVEEAATTFQDWIEKGFFAYVNTEEQKEHITEFDPAADVIILTVPLVGG